MFSAECASCLNANIVGDKAHYLCKGAGKMRLLDGLTRGCLLCTFVFAALTMKDVIPTALIEFLVRWIPAHYTMKKNQSANPRNYVYRYIN